MEDFRLLWLDYEISDRRVQFATDRGYYDAKELSRWDQADLRFIVGTKVGNKIVSDIIERRNSEFYAGRNLLQRYYLFGVKEKAIIGKTSVNVYIYFNPNRYMTKIRPRASPVLQGEVRALL